MRNEMYPNFSPADSDFVLNKTRGEGALLLSMKEDIGHDC